MPSDIKTFIGDKFDRELRQRFEVLVEENQIPLDLFRNEPNQQVLARFITGQMAEVLTDIGRPNAHIDGAIYMFILHVLGSESIGDMLDGGRTAEVKATGLAEAYAFDIGEENEPPRNEAPKVLFGGIKDETKP
jgi:hypothetical protein